MASRLPHAPAFEGLLYTVFQRLRQAAPNAGTGLCLAFTSANRGEGVTHTIHALLGGLAREPGVRTLVADSRVLRQLTAAPAALPSLCRTLPAAAETLYDLAGNAPGTHSSNDSWNGSWEGSGSTGVIACRVCALRSTTY